MPLNGYTGPWSDECSELAKMLWTSGVSAAKIAHQLGDPFTRNAIIGRARRMGWQTATKPIAPKSAPRQKRKREKKLYTMTEPKHERVAKPNAAELSFRCDGGITILELTNSTCRWPLGNPGHKDFRYCGADSEIGQVYCSSHCAVAYNGFSR